MLYIQGLYIQGVVHSRCCIFKVLYIHVLYIQGVVYSFVVHPRCCTSLVVHSRFCTNEVAPFVGGICKRVVYGMLLVSRVIRVDVRA